MVSKDENNNSRKIYKKKSNVRKFVLISITFVYLISLISIFLIVIVFPKLEENLGINSYIVKKGEISLSIKTRGLIIKDEKIFKTPTSGKPIYKYEDGVKVRKGEQLFDIVSGGSKNKRNVETLNILKKLNNKSDGTTLTAKITGLVSYYLDGYEKNYTPTEKTFKDISEDDFKKDYTSYNVKNDYFDTGEILYKLVDNNSYYIICYINNNNVYTKDIRLNESYSIKLGSSIIKARLTKVYRGKTKRKLIFKSDMYYKNLTKIRLSKIKIQLGEYSGLKIPNESIVRKNGYDGVYKITEAKSRIFVPINILSKAKDYSIISSVTFINRFAEEVSTLNFYDNIVRNPR